MKRIISLWPFLIFLLIFKSWFFSPFLLASDWPYFFPETIADFPLSPPAWAPTSGNGLGGEVVLYALDSYIYLINWLFVGTIGLPWEIVYKVFIFGFFILLSIVSSTYLIKTVLGRVGILPLLLSSLIFTANTYILMVVDGGQVGVALAYSLAPLVMASFIRLLAKLKSVQQDLPLAILSGLLLGVQVMFDARIAYLTIISIVLYFIVFFITYLRKVRISLYTAFAILSVSVLVVILINIPWILPLIVFQSNPTQDIIREQASLGAFKFFSFAYFSQSFSLLHPNWPENIFGKVYFMRPEFLIMPILAYSSLFFMPNTKDKKPHIIIFFVLLGFLGAFLAKGASEPFGFLNESFYQYIPGMSMFRDPTKFYLLTSLSYMVLIPFTLLKIAEVLRLKFAKTTIFKIKIQKYIQNAIFLCVICYLLFLIRPVFLNQLRGIFSQHQIPQEYLKLKDFLHNQPEFFRTAWVPQQQRYNFYSYNHPVVSTKLLFEASNSADIFRSLSDEKTQKLFSDLSIQYVIVPFDSFGDFFVKDGSYDENQYKKVIKNLDKLRWLKRVDGFGKIIVYKTLSNEKHFRVSGGNLTYKMINPFEYKIAVSNIGNGRMVFGENYSPYWVAQKDSKKISSKKTKEGFNSFLLEKEGEYRIYFAKQEIYNLGRVISLFGILFVLIILWKVRKK